MDVSDEALASPASLTPVLNRCQHRAYAFVLIAAVVVALLAAALTVTYPFTGDQALFVVFAHMMDQGAVLYRDIWDIKQPGIFWFTLGAGRLFGFNEIGVHLFEGLYWIMASVLISFALRSYLRRPWVAALFPLVGAGWYFASAHAHVLTQIETLLGPLLFAVAWLLLDPKNGRLSPARSFAAGIAAAFIAVFKLMAALIPVSVLVAAMAWWWRRERRIGPAIVRLGLPFAAGFLTVAGAVGAWIWTHGLADLVWFTWIEYPPQVLAIEPRPVSRLIGSTIGFAAVYAPLGLLALLGLISSRQGQITIFMLVTVLVAALIVLLQTWWSYHLFIFAVPIAVLALQGLDNLLEKGLHTRLVMLALVALLATPTTLRVANKVDRSSQLLSGASLQAYHETFAHYKAAESAASVVSVAPQAPIYVLGDPLIMYLLQADQAIPIHGWGPEFWTEELWESVASDLEKESIVAVFVADGISALASHRYPGLLDRLYSRYGDPLTTEGGVWLFPFRTGKHTGSPNAIAFSS